jgi:hypothetical protein
MDVTNRQVGEDASFDVVRQPKMFSAGKIGSDAFPEAKEERPMKKEEQHAKQSSRNGRAFTQC